MRDRVGFEHFALAGIVALNSWNSRDLPVPASAITATICPCPLHRQFERALHLLKLALAPDEPRQPAPRRELEVRPQRPGAHHLVHLDRLR